MVILRKSLRWFPFNTQTHTQQQNEPQTEPQQTSPAKTKRLKNLITYCQPLSLTVVTGLCRQFKSLLEVLGRF